MDEIEKKHETIECGKRAIINNIKANTTILHNDTLTGIGDDSAVLQSDSQYQTIVTTDIFAEGIHFDLTYTPLKHLGYKIVVAGISNIYAMNAEPRQILIGIAVSKRFENKHIAELYEGIHAACKQYNVDLIGGDITSSLTGICINTTSIGRALKDDIVYRKGAQPTDLLCVTGNLGAAYMGLQLLVREKTVFEGNPNKQPQLSGWDYILRRQLKPETPSQLLDYFKKKQIKPTSMTDISNAMASEILSICKESNMGCEIFEERIPIADETKKMCKELNIEPIVAALNGGDDFELLFTIELKNYNKIKDNDMFSIIGSINDVEKGTNIVTRDGSIIPLEQ